MAIWKTYQSNSKGQSMTQVQAMSQSRSGSNAVGLVDNRSTVSSPIQSVIQRAEPTFGNHVRNGLEKARVHGSNIFSWIGDSIDGYGVQVQDTEPKPVFNNGMLWSVKFKITGRDANTFSGCIVQHVRIQTNYLNRQGESKNGTMSFYEAWSVANGMGGGVDHWHFDKETFQDDFWTLQNIMIWGNLYLSKDTPENLKLTPGKVPLSGRTQHSNYTIDEKKIGGIEHRRFARCYFSSKGASGTVSGSDDYKEIKLPNSTNLRNFSQPLNSRYEH